MAAADGPQAGGGLAGWAWRRFPAPLDAARVAWAVAAAEARLPPPVLPASGLPPLPAGTPPPVLPPGGRAWLPARRIVAYYGNPLAPAMGVLGAYPPAEARMRLLQQAQAYQRLDPGHPVQPAIELVADVGQPSPGADGLYRLRMPYDLLAGELALARRWRALLILDLQLGRSTVGAELAYFAPFLAQPDVELALDPEFDMPPGETPGVSIGTMPAAQINEAVDELAALVRRYRLPEKVLIVHQFTPGMVPDWRGIRLQPGVQFVMDTDGFGGQGLKESNYVRYITDQPVPPVRYGGIKLFYRYDVNLLSPAQVLALRPSPMLVIYQ